jgi:DNA-binding transcriptional regulator GbsR (MarR family)
MWDLFGSLFDEREAIAVDVEKSMSNAVDEEIEMARQEAAAQRRAQEMRRKSIDERAARVLANLSLLQNGQC